MTSEIQIQILEYVRELISNGWIQNAVALDENGIEVEPSSHMACRFCLAGALTRARSNLSYEEGTKVFLKVAEYIGNEFGKSIVNFNDTSFRKKEDIIKVLDKLISREKYRLGENSHANL